MSKHVAVGYLCLVNVFKLSNESVFNSIPYDKAPAANRPEQVVHTLRTGIVGLLLQTR